MQAPSSRVGIFLVITVLVVAGIITAVSVIRKNNQEVLVEDETVGLTISREKIQSLDDTDGDGLLDWEEDLWGSDKNNPDTDGDGLDDGDEIDVRRDPTVKGPDDLLEDTREEILPSEETFYDDIVPGSLTNNLSINLAANYLNFKQGGQFTEDNKQQLVGTIVRDVDELAGYIEKYSTKDLLLMINTSGNLKEYGNNLAKVLGDNSEIMNNIQIADEKAYTEAMSLAYKNLTDQIVSIRVPSALANEHIRISNNLYNVAVSLEELSSYRQDPVRAIIAIKKYQQVLQDQPLAFQTISQYFNNNGIIFTSEESGNLWNQY